MTYSEGDFQVKVSRFSARSGESICEGAIVIFPPTGGSTFLDRSFARAFARENLDVYILEGWTGMDEEAVDLDLHQRLFERAQRALQVVVGKIEKPYVGLLGTSVGALHTAVAVSTQPKISAAFAIVGGLSIPEVIVGSDQKEMRYLKKERFARYGFKDENEYVETIEKHFHFDRLSAGLNNKRLGAMIAKGDTKVPTSTQIKLADTWKPALKIESSGGHVRAIFEGWFWHRSKIVDFLKCEGTPS
jgi:hypothetical protein